MVKTMKARLSERLREIMRTQPALDTQTKISKRSGVGQSTIGRLINEEQAATVDVLEQLAKGIGYARPEYLFLTPEEIALLDSWGRLGEDERLRVLGYIQLAALTRQDATLASSTRRLTEDQRAEQLVAQQSIAPPMLFSQDVTHQKQPKRQGRPPKRPI